MIKNIVCDMGNVLIEFSPEKLVEKYANNEEDKKALLDIVFYGKEWLDLDEGTLDYDDAIKIFRCKLPEHLGDTAEEILNTWTNYLVEDENMKKIVKKLKDKGYKTYILSNAPLNMKKYLLKSDLSKLFDGMIISAEEKISKPKEGIYKRLFEKYNLNPVESFFIDDRKVNIDSANKLGMVGHVHDMNNLESLISDFKKYGISID